MRPDEAAALAGVKASDLRAVSAGEARRLYRRRLSPAVLEVALAEADDCYYWRYGATVYLDDATFGPVVALEDLGYDSELGLYDRR